MKGKVMEALVQRVQDLRETQSAQNGGGIILLHMALVVSTDDYIKP